MSKNNFQLTNIIIQGYKSISYDCPLQLKLGDINILLGANGAGKSNIINFFKMMNYMMSKSFSKYVELNGTSNQLLHFGSKHTPQISAQLTFSCDKGQDMYHFNLENAMSDRLIITEENIGWLQKGKKPYTKQLEPNFKESVLLDSDNGVAKSIYNMLSSCKVYQFHDSSAEGPMRQTCPVETANYLQSQANNLPSFLLLLKTYHPTSYKRIVDYVSDVVPPFEDLYPGCEKSIKILNAVLEEFGNPELINHGSNTAPSKRIIYAIEFENKQKYKYNKPKSGKFVTENVGINKLRHDCPHFNQWLEKLLED